MGLHKEKIIEIVMPVGQYNLGIDGFGLAWLGGLAVSPTLYEYSYSLSGVHNNLISNNVHNILDIPPSWLQRRVCSASARRRLVCQGISAVVMLTDSYDALSNRCRTLQGSPSITWQYSELKPANVNCSRPERVLSK